MTAHDFLKGLIAHTQKLYLERQLYPRWMTGSTTKLFYPEFIVQDKEITLDISVLFTSISLKFTSIGERLKIQLCLTVPSLNQNKKGLNTQ